MKTRWEEFKAKYWRSRAVRERQMIAVVAAVLGPIVFYFLLWQPAHQAVAKLQLSVPVLQAQLAKFKENAAEIEALRHRPQLAALDQQAFKLNIEQLALKHQLAISISPIGAQEVAGIRITGEAISFAAWLNCLRELEQTQHIRAESVSVSASSQPGLVKISATLINGN
jgi:general secretion pathway protein M